MRTINHELHQKRRREILEAASICFSERGIRQSTMQEICTQANMSPGALYRYFPSKDSIILALATATRDGYEALLEHLRASDDVVLALRQAMPKMLQELTDPLTASFSLEIVAEAARNPDIMMYFLESEQRFKLGLAQALRAGQDSGVVDRSLNIDGFVHLFVNLLDAICGSFAFPMTATRKEIGRTLDELIRRLLSPTN